MGWVQQGVKAPAAEVPAVSAKSLQSFGELGTTVHPNPSKSLGVIPDLREMLRARLMHKAERRVCLEIWVKGCLLYSSRHLKDHTHSLALSVPTESTQGGSPPPLPPILAHAVGDSPSVWTHNMPTGQRATLGTRWEPRQLCFPCCFILAFQRPKQGAGQRQE